jgi:hypothetical protein
MADQADSILNDIETLSGRLRGPITTGMQLDGWLPESMEDVLSVLERLALQIRTTGNLPPLSERPAHMARYLDAWGIHNGSLYNDLRALGRRLLEAG